MPTLVLASTSRYRRELLARFGLPFDTSRPEVDETPTPGERADALAARLGRAKALAVAAGCDRDAWVIGSDQAAEVEGRLLGKPGGRNAAIAQLQAMRGRRVRFHTSIALANADGRVLEALDLTEVAMRELDDSEIARYVDAEQPFDCAGSFKAEGLGITLFDAIESRDPTALIGLPLIALCKLLRELGIAIV